MRFGHESTRNLTRMGIWASGVLPGGQHHQWEQMRMVKHPPAGQSNKAARWRHVTPCLSEVQPGFFSTHPEMHVATADKEKTPVSHKALKASTGVFLVKHRPAAQVQNLRYAVSAAKRKRSITRMPADAADKPYPIRNHSPRAAIRAPTALLTRLRRLCWPRWLAVSCDGRISGVSQALHVRSPSGTSALDARLVWSAGAWGVAFCVPLS